MGDPTSSCATVGVALGVFGTLKPLYLGCQHRGVYHPVGSTYDDACRTYTCTKTSQNGNPNYRTVRTRTRCLDYYGVCYESGSQFSYAINGRLYNQCSCKAHHDGYVSFTCQGK